MEVQEVPGYGRCAITTSAFSPGQDVLKEFPLITWQSESTEVTEPLARLVEAVNVEYEANESVFAVHTDAVFMLPVYMGCDEETRRE